jgi:hypothetical protein
LIAGAISMGLGGWLAARGEAYSPFSLHFCLFSTLSHSRGARLGVWT